MKKLSATVFEGTDSRTGRTFHYDIAKGTKTWLNDGDSGGAYEEWHAPDEQNSALAANQSLPMNGSGQGQNAFASASSVSFLSSKQIEKSLGETGEAFSRSNNPPKTLQAVESPLLSNAQPLRPHSFSRPSKSSANMWKSSPEAEQQTFRSADHTVSKTSSSQHLHHGSALESAHFKRTVLKGQGSGDLSLLDASTSDVEDAHQLRVLLREANTKCNSLLLDGKAWKQKANQLERSMVDIAESFRQHVDPLLETIGVDDVGHDGEEEETELGLKNGVTHRDESYLRTLPLKLSALVSALVAEDDDGSRELLSKFARQKANSIAGNDGVEWGRKREFELLEQKSQVMEADCKALKASLEESRKREAMLLSSLKRYEQADSAIAGAEASARSEMTRALSKERVTTAEALRNQKQRIESSISSLKQALHVIADACNATTCTALMSTAASSCAVLPQWHPATPRVPHAALDELTSTSGQGEPSTSPTWPSTLSLVGIPYPLSEVLEFDVSGETEVTTQKDKNACLIPQQSSKRQIDSSQSSLGSGSSSSRGGLRNASSAALLRTTMASSLVLGTESRLPTSKLLQWLVTFAGDVPEQFSVVVPSVVTIKTDDKGVSTVGTPGKLFAPGGTMPSLPLPPLPTEQSQGKEQNSILENQMQNDLPSPPPLNTVMDSLQTPGTREAPPVPSPSVFGQPADMNDGTKAYFQRNGSSQHQHSPSISTTSGAPKEILQRPLSFGSQIPLLGARAFLDKFVLTKEGRMKRKQAPDPTDELLSEVWADILEGKVSNLTTESGSVDNGDPQISASRHRNSLSLSRAWAYEASQSSLFIKISQAVRSIENTIPSLLLSMCQWLEVSADCIERGQGAQAAGNLTMEISSRVIEGAEMNLSDAITSMQELSLAAGAALALRSAASSMERREVESENVQFAEAYRQLNSDLTAAQDLTETQEKDIEHLKEALEATNIELAGEREQHAVDCNALQSAAAEEVQAIDATWRERMQSEEMLWHRAKQQLESRIWKLEKSKIQASEREAMLKERLKGNSVI